MTSVEHPDVRAPEREHPAPVGEKEGRSVDALEVAADRACRLPFVALVGTVRSASQIFSIAAYVDENSAWMRTAALIDPGNYRLQLKLSRSGGGRSRQVRCEHGLAARALFPNARAARNAADGCD